MHITFWIDFNAPDAADILAGEPQGISEPKIVDDAWLPYESKMVRGSLTVQPMIDTFPFHNRCSSSIPLTISPEWEFLTHLWMYFSGYSAKVASTMSPLYTIFVRYRPLFKNQLAYQPHSTSLPKATFILWMTYILWWQWCAIWLPLLHLRTNHRCFVLLRTGAIPPYATISIAIQWLPEHMI